MKSSYVVQNLPLCTQNILINSEAVIKELHY